MIKPARCLYAHGGVRCTKPGHKGPYCKAHVPREVRTINVVCESCGGGGLHYEDGLTYMCARCNGRGQCAVPRVLMKTVQAKYTRDR